MKKDKIVTYVEEKVDEKNFDDGSEQFSRDHADYPTP